MTFVGFSESKSTVMTSELTWMLSVWLQDEKNWSYSESSHVIELFTYLNKSPQASSVKWQSSNDDSTNVVQVATCITLLILIISSSFFSLLPHSIRCASSRGAHEGLSDGIGGCSCLLQSKWSEEIANLRAESSLAARVKCAKESSSCLIITPLEQHEKSSVMC